jgi:small conductance mechanosensitive channel
MLIIFGFVWSGSVPVFGQEGDANTMGGVAVGHVDTARNLISFILEFVVKYFFQALGGIIVLVCGWYVAKVVCNFAAKFLRKQQVDVTVSKFIVGAVKLLIVSFAVIVALGKFGIEIAPLIAGISVVGFGTSFALQGPLSNYAAGASLIFTKPFKVGEIVEVAGEMGEVVDIKLPRTELKTVDGYTIVIPNKHIVGEIIHNYSSAKRLDVNVGVSYRADIDQAINVVRDIVLADERIVKDTTPKVGISEFADSSVNIYARVWCKQDHYWDVRFAVNRRIYEEFKRRGIEIPFPRRDVHIFQQKEN